MESHYSAKSTKVKTTVLFEKNLLKDSTVKSFSRENRHTSPAFATKNKNLVWFISLN